MHPIEDAEKRLVYTEYHRQLFDKIIREYPNHYIFNAPRPLMGHGDWTGNFISGVFYAAVDPKGERADQMIDFNIRMDADLLTWFSKDDVIKEGKSWAKESGISYEELTKWYDFRDLVAHYIIWMSR